MKVIGQIAKPAGLASFSAAILAPLVAAAMAAIMSIHIVYSGNIRDSLSSKAESLLIDSSLRLRPSVPVVNSDITVISLDDRDMTVLPPTPSLLRDTTLEVYADVLKAVAAANPKFVVLSWLTNAHPAESTSAIPFAKILDATDLRSRFVLSLPFINDSKIPESLGKIIPVSDGDDCIYDVNRICSYPDGWDEWIVKKLVNTFWTKVDANHISSNLPYLNSYILNFPAPEGIRRLSFRQVLSGAPLEPNRVYFIGNDVTQDLRFRNAKYVLQRTATFEAKRQNDLQQDGIPFHEFWARLTQMFEAQTTVAVVPVAVERTLIVLYMICLALIMLRLGVVWAFAVLLANILLLPIANALALSYALVYLPSFNLIFGGIILCIVGMMISVSWSNYQRFRASSAAQHYRDVADIKNNFVSLVSHNLNTTVARLAGLIDIFKSSGLFVPQAEVITSCNRSIGELFICVRNVLTNLSMHERQRGASIVTIQRVIDDFRGTYTGMMKRLAVDYELEVAVDARAEAVFKGNVKILHQFVANLLGVSTEFGAEGCLVSLAIDDLTGRLRLVTKYFLPRAPEETIRAFQSAGAANGLGGFGRLTLGYIDGVIAWASGQISVELTGDNVVVDIQLDFASVTD